MASNVLKELVALIGFPAALSITRSYGGRTLRVPSRVSPTHPLTVLIGTDRAKKLCEEFGGVHIDIPSESTALLEQRNAQIRAEMAVPGAKVMRVARRYGLSRPMIRKIIRCTGSTA